MRRLKIILQSKYIFKILALTLLLFSYLYTSYYPFKSKYSEKDNTFIGTVKSYKIKDNSLVITLKAKEEIIIYYNYESLVFNSLNIGDKLKVTGTISKPKSSTNFNTFDYQKYLYHKKIYYIVKADKVDKLENNKKIINTIKNIINNKIKNYKSKDYISTLLLGNNTLDNDTKNNFRTLGISHLFSASGMHINLIISIIYYYLNKVSYNKRLKYIISDIFLLLYLIISFSSSLLRSTITYILLTINDIFNLNIKKIDILLLTLSICLIINPFIIYDIGFIYSYIISFFLSIFYIKSNKKILNISYIAVVAFLVSMPITIYTSYEINILSIIINILLTPILSIILLPLSILSLFIPILDDLLYLIINILEKISVYLSNINIFKLILSKPNIILLFLYYLVIIYILKNRKRFYLIIILIFIHNLLPFFNNNLEINMFDVDQGDSFLVSFPNNKGNIIIDTGSESVYRVKNEIIPYLKSKGIKKINYLIITHGDEDHIGGSISLIDNFKIEKVILNKDSFTDLEKDLIKELKNKNIKYSNKIDKINIKENYLYFLNNKEFDNENDNSNIIYFEYQKYKFLFMGDASSTTEEYLLDKYNIKDISFLKVGHHGSKTSSLANFINTINPKISTISVGEHNYYGHPNIEVLNNLSKSKIYRTDIMGSVNFKFNKNKAIINKKMKGDINK